MGETTDLSRGVIVGHDCPKIGGGGGGGMGSVLIVTDKGLHSLLPTHPVTSV